MLIGAVALSSCFVTSPLVCSVSDITGKLSVEVVEFKYQETPSATTMVAEGQRWVGLRETWNSGVDYVIISVATERHGWTVCKVGKKV
jgi:hypothetical protein